MTSTLKNGEHSMAEILATIRRQAAERRAAEIMRAGGGSIAGDDQRAIAPKQPPVGTGDAVGAEGRTDWAGDLPAILRPVAASSQRTARPGGRLTEALRVITSNGTAEAATPLPAGEALPEASQSPRRPAPSPSASRSIAAAPDEHSEPKREMVSFLDTRMRRMSQPPQTVVLPAAATPAAALTAPPADEPRAAAAGTSTNSDSAAQATEPEAASRSEDGLAGNDLRSEALARLPVLPDAAAELLRPVLRQWLADNMPRIVERALHMELADGVRKDLKSRG